MANTLRNAAWTRITLTCAAAVAAVAIGVNNASARQDRPTMDKPTMDKPTMDKPMMGDPKMDKPMKDHAMDGKGMMEGKTMSPADMQKMMEQCMVKNMPGEHQKMLQKLVGTFDAKTEMWMMPGAPAMESKGTCVNESVFDGRYVMGKYTGEMMGQPYMGMQLMGHDNMSDKFVSTWMDSMSSGIMYSTGTAVGNTLTLKGEAVDPMLNKAVTYTSKLVIESDSKHYFELWGPGMDGKDMKMMAITYTKKM